jgi:DNA-binding protein YbaB
MVLQISGTGHYNSCSVKFMENWIATDDVETLKDLVARDS